MEKITAGVIKGMDIRSSNTWAKLVQHEHAIEDSTVLNIDPPFTMSHAVRPGGPETARRSRPHYHANCARALYYIRGHIRHFFGPKGQEQVFDVEPGDFLYCPRGMIHSEINLNPDETAEWITVYVGCTSREASGRVFVD